MTERPGRRRFDVVGVLVLALWGASLIALAERHRGLDRSQAQAVVSEGDAGMHPGDEWQSVYLRGDRIGYLHLAKRRDQPSGWRIRSEIVLELNVMQQRQKVETVVDARLDDNLVVRSFEFRMDGGLGGRLAARGTVKGKTVHLVLDTGGEELTRDIELSTVPRLAATNRALLAGEGLAVGKSFTTNYFDPASMSERTLLVQVIGEERLHVMGESVETFVLRQQLEDLTLHAWVTRSGDVVKEELPLGLIAIRETEEEARYGTGLDTRSLEDLSGSSQGQGADLLELTAPRLVGEPPQSFSALDEVTFELIPPPERPFSLDGGRQSLDGAQLRIRRDSLPASASLPDSKELRASAELQAALADELLVQSAHPTVVARSRQIVGDASDAVVIVRKLASWVFEHIEKANVVGIPSALETLSSLRGDCNEHTTLFTALSRAAGVPTRINIGMAYTQERFYYHAWPEVWLAGRWIGVDPTWNQLPADLSHVRFVQGGLQNQLEMFKVIGTLKEVRLVSSRSRP